MRGMVKRIQVCSNKPRHQFKSIFVMASFGEGTKDCSNEKSHSFVREYNNEIVKVHGQALEIFSSRTSMLLTKLGTKITWVNLTQLFII